jgi:hypothetical protein
MLLEDLFETHGGKHAAQAYWNALNKLRSAWKEVFNEDLPTVGNRAKDAFEQAIELMTHRLSADAPAGKRLRDALDVEAEEDIADVLLRYADLDDIPPNVVKQSLMEQCLRLGDGRHELRVLLRAVLDQVFADTKTRRPRVGINRHWPRLLQYVRELEANTNWSTGKGVHLMNAGGGGRVAREPEDPAHLALRIDTSHL